MVELRAGKVNIIKLKEDHDVKNYVKGQKLIIGTDSSVY